MPLPASVSGRATMESSIWVATITGFTREPAGAHEFLLAAGNLLMRDFDAEISSGDHECVGETDDIIDMVEGGWLLDLRHQPGLVADQRTRLDHVAWLLDEGEGNPVHPELQPESKVDPILRGQRREIENGAGKVDALAVRDHAAHDDLGIDEVARRDSVTRTRTRPSSIRRWSPGATAAKISGWGRGIADPVALGSRQHEPDRLASLDGNPAAFDRADPDLRALEIEKDADRAADLLLQGPNGSVDPGMILVSSMAEVEPEGIDPGQEQRLEHLGRGACRPDGGDDLGSTITAHHSFGRKRPPPCWGASAGAFRVPHHRLAFRRSGLRGYH